MVERIRKETAIRMKPGIQKIIPGLLNRAKNKWVELVLWTLSVGCLGNGALELLESLSSLQ